MAHKTRVSGTDYTITKGKTRVNGTEYSISGGKTRVGGTHYTLPFGSTGEVDSTIGSRPVGSIVTFEYGLTTKTDREFIIVHKGLPSSDYDSSCDGVWVMAKNGTLSSAFCGASYGGHNSYGETPIHSSSLNDMLLTRYLDERLKNSILEVKVPYWAGVGNQGELMTQDNGLITKVFLPSATELGGGSDSGSCPIIGSPLKFFANATDSDRICYSASSGAVEEYWTRSPDLLTDNQAFSVNTTGGLASSNVTGSKRLRTVFILPYDFEI